MDSPIKEKDKEKKPKVNSPRRSSRRVNKDQKPDDKKPDDKKPDDKKPDDKKPDDKKEESNEKKSEMDSAELKEKERKKEIEVLKNEIKDMKKVLDEIKVDINKKKEERRSTQDNDQKGWLTDDIASFEKDKDALNAQIIQKEIQITNLTINSSLNVEVNEKVNKILEKVEKLEVSEKKSYLSLSSLNGGHVSAITKDLGLDIINGEDSTREIDFPEYEWQDGNEKDNSLPLMAHLSKYLESEGLIKEDIYKLVDVHDKKTFMTGQIGRTQKPLKGGADAVIVPYSIAGGFWNHCRVVIDWKTETTLKYENIQNQAIGELLLSNSYSNHHVIAIMTDLSTGFYIWTIKGKMVNNNIKYVIEVYKNLSLKKGFAFLVDYLHDADPDMYYDPNNGDRDGSGKNDENQKDKDKDKDKDKNPEEKEKEKKEEKRLEFQRGSQKMKSLITQSQIGEQFHSLVNYGASLKEKLALWFDLADPSLRSKYQTN